MEDKMTQHIVKNNHYEAIIGWDRPCQHYFASIINTESEDEDIVFQAQTLDVDALMKKVGGILGIKLPSDMRVSLLNDQTLVYPASNRTSNWTKLENTWFKVREV
jgi:hypothetical protein